MIEFYQLAAVSAVSWLVGYLLASGLARLISAVSDWLSDRRRAKTITLLEVDGKFVALPKGALYVPIRLDDK